MKLIKEAYYEGERPLFQQKDTQIIDTSFGKGESPLKESRNISLNNSLFTWKYPLWYSKNIEVEDTTFETMARSGIWYTHNIKITNSTLQAPKLFRRSSKIILDHVHFADAQETMWSCQDIKITNTTVNGDYFGKDSKNIYLDNVDIVGNYCFDGAKNVEVHNSRFISKDAFWNCENITIYDSKISGEYLAWNSKHIKFVNCTIESEQGLCYIDGLVLEHCKLLRTNLAFEYCKNIDADIISDVMSIKNPISGYISANSIGKIIRDDYEIDHKQTNIMIKQGNFKLLKEAK